MDTYIGFLLRLFLFLIIFCQFSFITSDKSYSKNIGPFTEEATQRGLVYQMQDYPQTDGHLGFGCGFADLDNDGDSDVIIVGSDNDRVGIFENDGKGNFTDKSAESGIPLLSEETGFVAFDYDNDGDLDIYFTRLGEANILVRNDGNFKFTDVTDQSGVGDIGAGESASAADFDGDGWLDLYVCNYNGAAPETSEIDNKLYKNLGNGRFKDVGVEQTVDSLAFSFQSVWTDYDRDGDVDLYLSNDRAPLTLNNSLSNQLWRNDNGQLVNVSEESGANIAIFSMGIAAGDFDGNGYPDLYCTNIDSYEEGWNPLLLNQGNGQFVESSEEAGVRDFITSWGSIFFDFDNDTHMDLYVNNMFEENVLYDCNGVFPCQEVASAAAVTGNREPGYFLAVADEDNPELRPSFGSAVGDVDNDGDMDILVNNLSGNVELFINNEGGKRNWIRYRVIGQDNNRFAVGGNVDTRVGSNWQFREIYAGGNGYLGQNEFTVHIGLDDADIVDEVVTNWPGGEVTRTISNVPANNIWTIYPPEKLGDTDNNGTVNLIDFIKFSDCFNTAFQPGCEVMDFTSDSNIQLNDFSGFMEVFAETPQDCDNNGNIDMSDILSEPTSDQNKNGVLDICPEDAEAVSNNPGGDSSTGCSISGKTTVKGSPILNLMLIIFPLAVICFVRKYRIY